MVSGPGNPAGTSWWWVVRRSLATLLELVGGGWREGLAILLDLVGGG